MSLEVDSASGQDASSSDWFIAGLALLASQEGRQKKTVSWLVVADIVDVLLIRATANNALTSRDV